MNREILTISRRSMLLEMAPFLGTTFYLRDLRVASPQLDVESLRARLLEMVNEERLIAKVPPVATDDLAARVAMDHAVDMARGEFASHWGRDGSKPYHRYSFTGGIDATAENISSADNNWLWRKKDLAQDVAYMHLRLYEETPPYDGHRRAILSPHHTHVGFGLAVEDLRLRVVELFVARFVQISPIQRRVKAGSSFELSGRLIHPEHVLHGIEVFYEPLPQPPGIDWLRSSGPYSLPSVSVLLRPKLPGNMRYHDGVPGVIDWDGRNFRTAVKLFKEEPGIYTIGCWVRKTRAEPAFIATHICVRAQ